MQGKGKHFGRALKQVKFLYVDDEYDHVLWVNVAVLSYRQEGVLSFTTLLLAGSTLVIRRMRYFCQILKNREAQDSMFYVSPSQYNNFFLLFE